MKQINEISEFQTATDFAVWMDEAVVSKVLSEFWLWYKKEEQTIEADEDEDHQEQLMDALWHKDFYDLPLPSLKIKFSICGKTFEVRDGLSLTSWPVGYVADSDNEAEFIEGIKDYAYGFYCGVFRALMR